MNGYIVDGINVNASTIDEYIAGNATGYIAGGWYKSVSSLWHLLRSSMFFIHLLTSFRLLLHSILFTLYPVLCQH